MTEESLLDGKNVTEKEKDIDSNVVAEEEDKELIAKKLRSKVVARRITFAVILFVLVGVLVYNYSPSFDDTVTHFLDDGPRIGNNVYGYIDVPDAFDVSGSFNPNDDNYAGGADGIAEGVQLKSKDGTMYITISLVTADRERDDYVGFGGDRYCLYRKKNYFYDSFDMISSMMDDMANENILETEETGLASKGTSVLVAGIWGADVEWKGQISGEEYQHRTFILGNPEQKGVFHCVTVAYIGDNKECVEYVKTFSLSPQK